MLTHYFIKPSTIDRIRASWLAPHIERYVELLHARSYSARSVIRWVPLLCAFGDFARANGARDPAEACAWVEAFVAGRVAGRVPRHGDSWKSAGARASYEHTIRTPVRRLLQVALEGDFQPDGGQSQRPFPFRAQAPGFVAYLRDERGLRSRLCPYCAFG